MRTSRTSQNTSSARTPLCPTPRQRKTMRKASRRRSSVLFEICPMFASAARKGRMEKTVRRDEAKTLAANKSIREFVVELLARMELHRRDIWYDPNSGKSECAWLRDTFELINNGRHPDFTLPSRIELVVPDELLSPTDLGIRIIDTKGIERTAARADLEHHLDETHTLAVLCSGFNEAPGTNARLLLERANKAGVRNLETSTALLVLPHSGQALAVKHNGIRVEIVTEGYEVKHEQIKTALDLRSLIN